MRGDVRPRRENVRASVTPYGDLPSAAPIWCLVSSPTAREVLGRRACFRGWRYAAPVIPWIIIAVIAVPLVVVGFMATRRNTAATEAPADANARARAEQEFAEAESYEAKWHEEDKERYHQERLP